MKSALFASVVWLCAWVAEARAEIILFPAHDGIPHNDDFSVKVRAPGSTWQDLFEYSVQVVDRRDVCRASLVTFDFTGSVEVSVTNNRSRIETARIRPPSADITPTVKGDVLTSTLTKPCNLSVEVNGDVYHNLHVFTNAPEADVPDPKDPNVIYIGPGVHTFTGSLEVGVDRVINGQFGSQSVAASVIDVPSGKTLYLAGGAVVKAAIRCRNVENVRIRGRGILLDGREGVQIVHSKNVTIDDLILIDPQHYTVFGGDVHGLTIRNLRAFSCGGNGDGIDLMSSTDVLIDGVFLRNSDNTIALYNHRWDFYGNTRNVTVRNSALWADVAHPIHMGTHGNPAKPETLAHLVFSNIDILEHNEPQLDYQGCMSINVSDANLARDKCFEDIRVDDFTEGQLVNLRVAYNKNTAPRPAAASRTAPSRTFRISALVRTFRLSPATTIRAKSRTSPSKISRSMAARFHGGWRNPRGMPYGTWEEFSSARTWKTSSFFRPAAQSHRHPRHVVCREQTDAAEARTRRTCFQCKLAPVCTRASRAVRFVAFLLPPFTP